MLTFTGCLKKKTKGLESMEVLSLIIGMGDFYHTVDETSKHDPKFKSLKKVYNELVRVFVSQHDFIAFYNEIFEVFGKDFNFNYKKYQFLKIFYLVSSFYYANIDETKKYQTNTYFIELYEKYSTINFNMPLTKKEIEIILSICVRIMFEYPDSENFFSNETKKKGNRKPSLNLSEMQFGSKSNSRLNLLMIGNNSMNIENNVMVPQSDSTIKNNSIQNKGFGDEYDSFTKLFHKFSLSHNLNDYVMKSIMLVIFENNSNLQISLEKKLKFLTKTKHYSHLLDYDNLINLKYYNKSTHEQFLQISSMFENNKENLGNISYELFLYLTMKIVKLNISDKCTFNHFFSSKKVSSQIISIGIENSKDFATTFVFNYELLIKEVLPFARKSYIFDLLFKVIKSKKSSHIGEELLNRTLSLGLHIKDKTKYNFISKVALLQLLIKIAKDKSIWETNVIDINENGLSELFNEDLIKTKFNALFQLDKSNTKRKIYIQAYFDLLLTLTKKSKNKKYIFLLERVLNAESLDSTKNNFFYQCDKICFNQKNSVNKVFSSYGTIDIPCISVLLLMKSMKKYYKEDKNDFRLIYKNFAISSFYGVKLIWNEHKECKANIKENKDIYFGTLYNKVKNYIEEGIKKNTIDENNLLNGLEKIFEGNNNIIKSSKAHKKSDVSSSEENDDSFCSCNSTKSIKNKCAINKRKKFISQAKKNQSNFKIANFIGDNNDDKMDNYEDRANLSTIVSGTNMDFSVHNQTNPNLSFFISSNQVNTQLDSRIVSSSNINMQGAKPPPLKTYEVSGVNSSKTVVLFPKHTLLKRIFSIFFKDILFYNKDFVKMKKYYNYYFTKVENNGIEQNVSIDGFPNYPTVNKNYTPLKLFYNGIFLRNDIDFFSDEYFKKTHSYFTDQVESISKKRLFVRKSKDKMLEAFAMKIMNDDKENVVKFKCELITNKNVVFGEMSISSSLLYFKSQNKDKFIDSLTEDVEKEQYLLCSYINDYSNRDKQVILFKQDIIEMINRRFLYQFQACEIFLQNGKSYFFNFFSEEKKIEFFSIFKNTEKTYPKLKLITNLKDDFRDRDYMERWLNGKMTNLSYLLLINKYASRSYNDTNQYPVLPWVVLKNGQLRNMKYPMAAQTPDDREYLLIKYDNSTMQFASHYNIHFSNSSFVIYYLVRVNPFTDGQITLQSGHFDSPNRQMHSLEECMTILEKYRDSRELIPQFFLSQEFFYNYNCNFFGYRANDKKIVHNLIGLENKKPYEYIMENLELLNNQKIKGELHYFIDNIFGVGQIGRRENFNTYDKYCYQELVNLKSKVNEYRDKNYDYALMKEKIERKINKIISFGQTPFKLFEEKHKENNNDIVNSQRDEYYEISDQVKDVNQKEINVKNKVIFVKTSNNFDKKQVIYICVLNKSQYEIKFYYPNLSEAKNIRKIIIQQKIKILEKINLFNDEFKYGLKYNPKFIMIDFNINIFIVCRFKDCSFTLFTNLEGSEPKKYLTESFITTIVKLPEKNFMTGHHSGKIMEWKLIGQSEKSPMYFTEEKAELKRSLLAHDAPVNGIYIDETLGIIITSGEDYVIYIRKYYDFEVLTAIDLINEICFDIQINNCFMYTMLYNEKVGKYNIKIYTLNGIEVHKGDYDYINNFSIDENNNVLVGYYRENKIKIFNPTMKKEITQINIEAKKNKTKNAEKPMFMNFVYKKELQGVVCTFSNSDVIKVTLNYEQN